MQGVAGSEKRFGDPVEAALRWQEAGAEWIHLVDLDAAFGRGHNRDLLARIVGTLDIDVEMSGGIRDDESLEAAMTAGCRRVNIGTAALEQPEWCASAIASHGDRIAIGLDVRGRTLAARGWTRDGGDLYDVLARLDAEGCARYVVTDVNKDGMLQGPNLELLRDVCAETDRPVVASGGITELADLEALMGLVDEGVEGAIVGTALYEGRFTLDRRPRPDLARPAPARRAVSLAVRVIPCLDVDAGRVVKGVNFQQLRDAGDPVELAKVYDAEGADELTFLDISASHEGRTTTMEIVSRTAEQVFIPLTVGGGVTSVEDVDRLLRAGADKVAVNTAAIRRPELVAEIADRFGNQVLVLSVDARRAPGTDSGFEVTTHGGRESAGLDALAWAARAAELGAGEILLNAMDADGTTDGFDLELIRLVRARGDDPGDRQRWRRRGRALRPGGRGRRRRRAGRHGLPLRHPAHPRGQGRPRRAPATRGSRCTWVPPVSPPAPSSSRTAARRPTAPGSATRSSRRTSGPRSRASEAMSLQAESAVAPAASVEVAPSPAGRSMVSTARQECRTEQTTRWKPAGVGSRGAAGAVAVGRAGLVEQALDLARAGAAAGRWSGCRPRRSGTSWRRRRPAPGRGRTRPPRDGSGAGRSGHRRRRR